MSLLDELAEGVQDLLTAGGVTGVILGQNSTTTADRMVSLTPYLIDSDRATALDLVGISIRFRVPKSGRGKPLIVMQGAVFDLLDGLQSTVIGGVRVGRVDWRTSTPAKDDEAGRPEAIDTYHFTCVRASRTSNDFQQ